MKGLLCQTVFPLAANQKTKGLERRLGPWVIIGRFGGMFDLVHFRGSYLVVDLEDMRSVNLSLGAIGCDDASQLHLPHTKSPMRYLLDSQTIIFRQIEQWNLEP